MSLKWTSETAGQMFKSPALSKHIRLKARSVYLWKDLIGTYKGEKFVVELRPWHQRFRNRIRAKWQRFRYKLGGAVLNLLGMRGEDYCDCDVW